MDVLWGPGPAWSQMAFGHSESLVHVGAIIQDAESDRAGGELFPFAGCGELDRHATSSLVGSLPSVQKALLLDDGLRPVRPYQSYVDPFAQHRARGPGSITVPRPILHRHPRPVSVPGHVEARPG